MVTVFPLEVFNVDAGPQGGETESLLGAESGKPSFPIRAVPSFHVLKGFSLVFAENIRPKTEAEAERLYGLSEETEVVDHFISHSWSAGRIWKWGAMSDYYHRFHAILIANLVSVALGLCGYLYRTRTGHVLCFGVAFSLWTLVPAVVAIATVALGHSIVPRSGSKVFLDRLCIHQWDEELKQRGVRSLGDVLRKSQQIVVLLSGDYMERLWCMFELATFSAHKRPLDMVFIPLWMPPFLYAVMIGCTLMLLFTSIFQDWETEVSFLYPMLDLIGGRFGRAWSGRFFLAHSIPAIPLCYVVRAAVIQKTAMLNWVANFSLEDSKLTVEADRAFIYDHIDRLFGSTQKFEEFVRSDVLRLLHQVVGHAWQIPYAWGLFAFQPYMWFVNTDSMSTMDAEIASYGLQTWKQYFFVNYLWFSPVYLAMPLTLKLVALLATLTWRWPFYVGLVMDVFVFLAMVLTLAVASWQPVILDCRLW